MSVRDLRLLNIVYIGSRGVHKYLIAVPKGTTVGGVGERLRTGYDLGPVHIICEGKKLDKTRGFLAQGINPDHVNCFHAVDAGPESAPGSDAPGSGAPGSDAPAGASKT